MSRSRTKGPTLWTSNRVNLFAGFILLLTLSTCQATKPASVPAFSETAATDLPSPMATIHPTITPLLPTETAYPTRPFPPLTVMPLTETILPFLAFPVKPDEYIALINGRVIDGTGAPAWLDWTVLIQGGRIIDAGPDVIIPDGARLVDLTGQTLLPGMFDMHGHLYAFDGLDMNTQFDTYPKLYLAGGVTTIFTAGDFDPEGTLQLRENIRNGEAAGPHILAAGPYFNGGSRTPSWMLKASDPEKMEALYHMWGDRIDGVKIYNGIPEDQFKVIIEAAHSDGLTVTSHLESISGMRAIELGLDGIEHGLFSMSEFFPKGASFEAQYCAISRLDLSSVEVTNIVNALVEHGTYLDPTIIVFQPELPDFKPLVEDWEKYLHPNARKPLRRFIRSIINDTCLKDALDKQAQFVKVVHDRGGLIITGTDPVLPILLPGYGLHRELENLVAAGLTPLEAIQAATLNSARAMRLDYQLGSIAEGKIADLVIVAGNPDEDITAIVNIRMVFKDGVPYLPDALRKSVEGLIGRDN